MLELQSLLFNMSQNCVYFQSENYAFLDTMLKQFLDQYQTIFSYTCLD